MRLVKSTLNCAIITNPRRAVSFIPRPETYRARVFGEIGEFLGHIPKNLIIAEVERSDRPAIFLGWLEAAEQARASLSRKLLSLSERQTSSDENDERNDKETWSQRRRPRPKR